MTGRERFFGRDAYHIAFVEFSKGILHFGVDRVFLFFSQGQICWCSKATLGMEGNIYHYTLYT